MQKKITNISIAVIVFILFFYICSVTPLAGDDWGYALNGLKGNPFITAFEFYGSWSGRFFSELYGFLVAPHKMLWNILNPCLFVGIFVLIMEIAGNKKNDLVVGLTVIFLMLSVKDYVRMETYTWVMGTTYVIPLFLALVIIYCYKKILIDERFHKIHRILICVCSFVACLMMENISAVILLLNISVLLYQYIYHREKYKQYIIYSVISLIAFVILRSSPGANYRLLNEHAAFVSLNLFEKIALNWNNFIRFTFLDNKYMMLVLSIVLICFVAKRIKERPIKILLISIFALGVVQSLSSAIYGFTKIEIMRYLFDQTLNLTTPICTVIYIIYVIAVFVTILKQNSVDFKVMCITALIMAGLCNGAMLLSPIFGSRSSLYTIYFIILLTAMLLSECNLKDVEKGTIVLVLVALNLLFIKKYYDKYSLVYEIQNERMGQIEYYRDHPESEEAWLVRMPIYSIHSADIEEWDTYHMDTFKEYYGLNPDMKVIFYYKEGY